MGGETWRGFRRGVCWVGVEMGVWVGRRGEG